MAVSDGISLASVDKIVQANKFGENLLRKKQVAILPIRTDVAEADSVRSSFSLVLG
jgi:hypothetical protein